VLWSQSGGVNGEGHAVLLWREGVDRDGLLAGLEAAVGRAVQQAAEDQHAESGSEPAEQGSDGD
jgi:hypothetical protein